MRTIIIILSVLLLAFSITSAAEGEYRTYSKCSGQYWADNNIRMDIDDGTVIIYMNDRDEDRVEITEDYELYINGRYIEVDESQQELLSKYYNKVIELVEYAEQIGLKGASIGLEGAKIGLMATAGVFKLIFSDYYESDDFEEELEREAEQLEAAAEDLEIEAEKLEEIADQLEKLTKTLKDQVSELDELDWF